jgi:hypothetical protein
MRPGVYQLPIEPDSLNSHVLVGAKAGALVVGELLKRRFAQRWVQDSQ